MLGVVPKERASAQEAYVAALRVTMLGAAGLLVAVTGVAWVALQGVPKVLDDPAEAPVPV